MEAYTGFASVYDLFMGDVPYEQWEKYLYHLLKSQGVTRGTVVDLGCGTGSITELLARRGYDMIGIDYSPDMLAVAQNKMYEKGQSILYLLQDMTEFQLAGQVQAMVSICDSMNYILEDEDLKKVFAQAACYLESGGVFIFDMNTEYKYAEIMGDNTIAENQEDSSFIWENFYDKEQQINEYDLTLFIREEGDLYRKEEEFHYQRAYSLELVKDLMKQGGLAFVAAYDAFTEEAPHEKSERIYVIGKKE